MAGRSETLGRLNDVSPGLGHSGKPRDVHWPVEVVGKPKLANDVNMLTTIRSEHIQYIAHRVHIKTLIRLRLFRKKLRASIE